ncbi:MAG: ATP synthase F1 subunit delta [Mangrovibacterium sp.]
MNQSKIAVRYAKALFSLARDKDLLDTLYADTGMLAGLCAESADFRLLLENPALKTQSRTWLLESILEEKISPLCMAFIRLLVRNRREKYLSSICRYFGTLIRREQGVHTAILTSAVPLGEETSRRIRSFLEKELKGPVELSLQADPKLIGGFVLRVDDRQVDVSMTSRLRKIRQSLLETEL